MYFNPDIVLQNEFLLNFIVSLRGGGKTFSTLLNRVDHFIDTGKQFVYLRRTEIERDQCITTLLSQLQAEGFHTERTFRTHKDYITCDGKIICYCLAISTAYKYKSVSFHDVDFILFDEFIDENNRYLKGEVTKFLSFIETIGRMRDITIFCLGNQSTKFCPYYKYFDVQPSEGRMTRYKKKSILIYDFEGAEYKELKKKTKFGQLIAGTEYGNFMLENEAIQDDYSFIDKLDGYRKVAIANIIIDKTNIVVYEALGESYYFFFMVRDEIKDIKTVNYDSMLIENSTLDIVKNNPLTKRIKMNINRGTVRFYNMQVKLLINSFIF